MEMKSLDIAANELSKVRDAMLDAMLESDGRITSESFKHLNALEAEIEELKKAYAPKYEEFRFADLF